MSTSGSKSNEHVAHFLVDIHIHNKNHDLSISIYFFHNDDPRDREWIKYQIVVESVRDPSHPVVFDDSTF